MFCEMCEVREYYDDKERLHDHKSIRSLAGSIGTNIFFFKTITVNSELFNHITVNGLFSASALQKNLQEPLSDYIYNSESCIHLTCQISNTQNASIQNVVQKCKEYTKEPMLVLYHAVGYALIADCSKKTISRIESFKIL